MFTAVVSGFPAPEVRWYKGKWREVKSYGRFKIEHDDATGTHTLSISTLDKPDTSGYRSVACNSFLSLKMC